MGKQLVAWQGISVEVPEDWTLGAIGAGERSGYLRLDDRDMPRLEVKWEHAPRGSDPELVVRRFLNMLKRGRKGQRAEEVRRFGEWLEGALGIPVRFFDERLTTKAAEAILRAEGRKVERERKEAVSASLILEGYLKLRRARESD